MCCYEYISCVTSFQLRMMTYIANIQVDVNLMFLPEMKSTLTPLDKYHGTVWADEVMRVPLCMALQMWFQTSQCAELVHTECHHAPDRIDNNIIIPKLVTQYFAYSLLCNRLRRYILANICVWTKIIFLYWIFIYIFVLFHVFKPNIKQKINNKNYFRLCRASKF